MIVDSLENIRSTLRTDKAPLQQRLGWLGPARMLVMAIIAFGYASTMPRGPGTSEYLRTFG